MDTREHQVYLSHNYLISIAGAWQAGLQEILDYYELSADKLYKAPPIS